MVTIYSELFSQWVSGLRETVVSEKKKAIKRTKGCMGGGNETRRERKLPKQRLPDIVNRYSSGIRTVHYIR
jgi:hypothetical protein